MKRENRTQRAERITENLLTWYDGVDPYGAGMIIEDDHEAAFDYTLDCILNYPQNIIEELTGYIEETAEEPDKYSEAAADLIQQIKSL